MNQTPLHGDRNDQVPNACRDEAERDDGTTLARARRNSETRRWVVNSPQDLFDRSESTAER